MSVSIKLPSGITVSSPAVTIKEAFKDLSFWTNEYPHKCGNCGKPNVVPSHRIVNDDSYFEAKCTDCGYTLSFGQHKKGDSLYSKERKEGWKKPYTGGSERNESPQSRSGMGAASHPDDDSIPY